MLDTKNIRPYYKTRIILTFVAVTILLVIIISQTAYLFIRELYLRQLGEQVEMVSSMVAAQIEPGYLELLEIGAPTGTTGKYFNELFSKNANPELLTEIFIFGNDFKVLVHSNPNYSHGEYEPRLVMNRKEISELKINQGTASLPFKGNDNKWYLWGFYRLNSSSYLAIRESAERFNELDKLSSLFWYIGLGGVIISIAAGWIMANAITNPLTKLAAFSKEIGKGNFSAEAPRKMHGEIKLLSDSMDRMKQNLSRHQEEKENMLAQIAHEIRNPLGGILLLVNLIKENQADFDKNKEYLEKIIKEINGLKKLITSYLEYSKPMFASPSWVDLNKTIADVENVFKVPLKEKNIIVEKNLNLEKMYFDEGHLRQILINLMNNSIDAISHNGIIKITSNAKPGWELIFKDDGPGISQEDFNRIFNPFFTTKRNGTGLGLAISKKLSSENNAELIARKNGKGATFVITKLPV